MIARIVLKVNMRYSSKSFDIKKLIKVYLVKLVASDLSNVTCLRQASNFLGIEVLQIMC